MSTEPGEEAGPGRALSPAQLRRRDSIKWNRYGPDVAALWVAEMDLPTAPVILEALHDAVRREAFGYPRRAPDTGLPDALASWCAQRYGWSVDPGRIHLVPDVLKGVELAIDAYSPPGSALILPTPAYMPFWELPDVIEHPIVAVPSRRTEGRWSLDLDGIAAAFADGAGTLLLCHPYNPLGRDFTRAELDAVAAVVTAAGGRVVADEIHAPLVYDGTHVPYASISAETAAHTVTVTSGSKGWNLAGLKCAQVVLTNDADDRRWREIPHLKTHGASLPGIAANLTAYREGGPWLDATIATLDHRRRLLAELLDEHLPEVGYTIPEATYLAWLDFRALELPSEPADFFLSRARVAMNPGLDFGEDGRGHARLNFATSPAILEQAVAALAGAVPAAPAGASAGARTGDLSRGRGATPG